MAMSLADLFNVGSEFEFEGKTYAAKDPDQLEQGRFQRHLQDKITNDILNNPLLDERQREALLYKHSVECGLGEFEWGGPGCLRAFMTWKGVQKYYEIMFAVDPDTAKRMVEAPIHKTFAAIREVAAENPKLFEEVLAMHLGERGLRTDWLSELLSYFSSTPPSGTPEPSTPSSDSVTGNSGSGGGRSSEPETDSQKSVPCPD